VRRGESGVAPADDHHIISVPQLLLLREYCKPLRW
jgi:hypothetical protein